MQQKVPGTGELVTMGVDAAKPYVEVGVISCTNFLSMEHKNTIVIGIRVCYSSDLQKQLLFFIL